MGSRSMKDVGGAVLAGSSPPFLGRERAAVNPPTFLSVARAAAINISVCSSSSSSLFTLNR